MHLFPAIRRPHVRRTISIITVLVIVFLSVSPLFNNKVLADTFQNASVTITDSRAAATNVTYNFTEDVSASTPIDHIDIYFCTTATGTCNAPAGLNTGTPTMSSNTIDGSGESVSKISALDNTIRVGVGSTAPQTTTTLTMQFTGITNPTGPDISYYARVTSYDDTSTEIDSAQMGMAVLKSDSIAVTAQVESTFTFTVTALTSADGNVNGEAITLDNTTDDTIPYGVLTANTPSVAAHELAITTNANNGYQITVQADADPPLSDGSTGNNIDTFTGSNSSPTTWSAPTSTTENVNTGFFGYTTNDTTLTNTGDGVDRFTVSGGNKWAGTTTSAAEVAYSDVAVDNETTDVGWQIEVDQYQPPGSYSGSVVLIATPTY